MPVFRFFFMLFLLIPLIEIYVLVKVGEVIGAWPTILAVVFTAVLGAAIIRMQGFKTLARIQNDLAVGKMPTEAMLEGVVLLVAGLLLLTPGFFTDTLGFLALVPPLRRWVIRRWLMNGSVSVFTPGVGPAPHQPPSHPGHSEGQRTIEGEYTRDD